MTELVIPRWKASCPEAGAIIEDDTGDMNVKATYPRAGGHQYWRSSKLGRIQRTGNDERCNPFPLVRPTEDPESYM